ncbi:DUF3159 domain-containing protein [Streptomyces caniferus]|uniref:DUF3159 domain-containing protein n=1 Tax=Streptomyces caniferus TaxID=285557 RepID=A0ABZ1VJV9_9ACTN|nr:DUF3159 domain-containing protein [Streptomyces caniferus]
MDPAVHGEAGGEDAIRSAMRHRLRNAVINVVPVFGFTLSFALTHRLAVALALALAAGAAVCVYRAARREPVWGALAALGLVCVAGALAAGTGQATSFFLPSLMLHAVMAVVSAVMLLLGWPPMGVVVGLITKEGTGWRRCRVRRRAFTRGNLVVLAGNLKMLAIQIPLFLSGRTVALGAVDVLGPVVIALGALLGWRVYRRVLGGHRCGSHDRMTVVADPVVRREPLPGRHRRGRGARCADATACAGEVHLEGPAGEHLIPAAAHRPVHRAPDAPTPAVE